MIRLACTVVFASVCFCSADDQSLLINNLKAGKAQTIVTYGTSLTAEGAWVSQLQGVLNRKFPGLVKVVNSGECAMWSKWGVDHLENRVIEKKPDAVIMEFAINDAFLQHKMSTLEARKNLTNMIGRISGANKQCQIVLMTMNVPIGEHFEQRPQIDDYYEVYRQVAKECKLLLIDHHSNWKKVLQQGEAEYRKYVPDGIHPNALGCENVILPQLLKSLGIDEPGSR